MKNCKTCANAIFDETFGEYKCKELRITIYPLTEECPCGYYKKGKPQVSKRTYESD